MGMVCVYVYVWRGASAGGAEGGGDVRRPAQVSAASRGCACGCTCAPAADTHTHANHQMPNHQLPTLQLPV